MEDVVRHESLGTAGLARFRQAHPPFRWPANHVTRLGNLEERPLPVESSDLRGTTRAGVRRQQSRVPQQAQVSKRWHRDHPQAGPMFRRGGIAIAGRSQALSLRHDGLRHEFKKVCLFHVRFPGFKVQEAEASPRVRRGSPRSAFHGGHPPPE